MNKGAAGDGPTWMLERMEWDIYNENDPLGYGACDEVYVCLGGNELSYAAYTDGRMDEDFGVTYVLFLMPKKLAAPHSSMYFFSFASR